MLQVHVESTKNDKIYRKLQVDEGQTLIGLDYTLSVAFDLFEQEEYGYVLPIDGEWRSVQLAEVGAEPIAQWLANVDDEILYQADQKYEMRLRVERVTDEKVEFDCCLEGDGNILTNRKKRINLDEMNELLMLKPDFSSEALALDELFDPDFEMLLQQASELNKLKPWKYFDNEQIFALKLEAVEAMFFVSIIGAGNEEFGVLLFDEELGYASLAEILSQRALSEEFHINFSALSLNFVDRKELEDEDYLLIKDYGFSFRGKKNWPQFRSYFAGSVPDLPTYAEVEVMKMLLTGVIEIAKLAKAGYTLPLLEPSVYPAFSIDASCQLIEPFVLQVKERKLGSIEIDVNDLERAQFKRKQKVQLQMEFELFYLPYPVADEEQEERPYYPVVCIVMDRMTGEVLAHDILPFPKVPFTQQQVFWKLMMEFPVRPEKVFVTKDMQKVLAPLAKLLNVELVVSELPNVQGFKEYMLSMPPDFE